jgi:hypothetical protein
MRKTIGLLLLVWLLDISAVWAQSASFTVLYTNSVDGITVSREGGNEQRVFAGMKLPADGRLRLQRSKKANLLYDGQKVGLEGPSLYELDQLAQELEAQSPKGFFHRFWSFVGNAIRDTDDAEQVEQYHRRYLTNVRAGIDGFASRRFSISAPQYLSQRIDAPQLTFRWDSVAAPNGYNFTIRKEISGEPVFTALAKDAQVSVALRELRLQPEAVYVWSVSALQPDSSRLESPEYYFSYEPQAYQHLLEELSDDESYRQLSPTEQELYLLYQLEQDGLYNTAYAKYQQLSGEGSLASTLYQKLWISFLARMDALPEAQQQLK